MKNLTRFSCKVVTALTAGLSVALAASPRPVTAQEFTLPGGRRSVLLAQGPLADSFRWMVFVPGSGCDLYRPENSPWISMLRQKLNREGVLVISKGGVALDGSCRNDEFHRSSVRAQRINDVLAVLHRVLPANAEILLLAESEGAYLAPDIALADSRVKALILFSGGTRSWIEEEIAFVRPSERPNLAAFFQSRVVGHPTFTDFYKSWTYAEMNSFNTHQTADSLRLLKIPILALNGDHDQATWVDGTRADLAQLIVREAHRNIESVLLRGAGHPLNCVDISLCDQTRQTKQINDLLLDFVSRVLPLR